MNSILAKKIDQGQKFLENGKRIPVTKLGVDGNVVVAIKTSSVQLGFEKRVKLRAPKSSKSPYQFLREVRMADGQTMPAIGDALKASEIFKPGDIINVTGISKGKGYAGGVKRYNFRGGPRTHGQSDRERAPGSIGTTTTPGRVLKGKRMAGRMGHEQVTVRNIRIVSVDDSYILVKGLVPGVRNGLLVLKKVGEDKKFVPLYADKVKEETKVTEETKETEVKVAASAKGSSEPKEEKKEEVAQNAK